MKVPSLGVARERVERKAAHAKQTHSVKGGFECHGENSIGRKRGSRWNLQNGREFRKSRMVGAGSFHFTGDFGSGSGGRVEAEGDGLIDASH